VEAAPAVVEDEPVEMETVNMVLKLDASQAPEEVFKSVKDELNKYLDVITGAPPRLSKEEEAE